MGEFSNPFFMPRHAKWATVGPALQTIDGNEAGVVRTRVVSLHVVDDERSPSPNMGASGNGGFSVCICSSRILELNWRVLGGEEDVFAMNSAVQSLPSAMRIDCDGKILERSYCASHCR